MTPASPPQAIMVAIYLSHKQHINASKRKLSKCRRNVYARMRHKSSPHVNHSSHASPTGPYELSLFSGHRTRTSIPILRPSCRSGYDDGRRRPGRRGKKPSQSSQMSQPHQLISILRRHPTGAWLCNKTTQLSVRSR